MSRYPELAAKVDAFFQRVQQRHGADMQCGSGCHHCCYVRLTITRVEADQIREEVAGWTAEQRAQLAANVASADPARCAALTPQGRCLVYAARPFVCRSHGAPIRMRTKGSLPVVVSCSANFTERGPAAADADCIFDQTTLSAMVHVLDREAGHLDGERIDLAAVLADC